MPVPTYDHFIEPLLRYLAEHKDGALIADVYEALATANGADSLMTAPSYFRAALKHFSRTASAGRTIV